MVSCCVCVDESKKFHSGGTTARIDSPENKKKNNEIEIYAKYTTE